MTAAVYCALVHHPVRDRAGETVTTAVTTLDVHDIARSARTYGVSGYYLVTPIDAQHVLIDRILQHWRTGAGVQRMPERGEALSLCHAVHALSDVYADIELREGRRPRVIATAARSTGVPVATFPALRSQLADPASGPFLLLFGTGHGLSQGLLESVDLVLEPIHGPGTYNHLSVRSAAAIALDRLLGCRS